MHPTVQELTTEEARRKAGNAVRLARLVPAPRRPPAERLARASALAHELADDDQTPERLLAGARELNAIRRGLGR